MPEQPKSAAKKASTKKTISKGQALKCEVCGLEVTVDDCGCAEAQELLCCSRPMKERPAKPPMK